MDAKHLDCCKSPSLRNLKTLLDTSHNDERVEQCAACGVHWFSRWWEYCTFDGPDEVTEWYTRLTAEEAQTLLDAEAYPDLSFLGGRPSIMFDDTGVKNVPGAPSGPGPGPP